jgi:hypothetical protein
VRRQPLYAAAPSPGIPLQLCSEYRSEHRRSKDAPLADSPSNPVGCGYAASLQALLPEKRFLYYSNLPKAVGSLPLGRRLQRLRPDIHIFGHTHFAWDATIDGERGRPAGCRVPSKHMRPPERD